MNSYLLVILLCLNISFYCVLCDYDDILTEGSECESKEGKKGTCVDIHKCMQYVSYLKNKKRPQLCSFNGNVPIVCCTDCDLVNDTRNVLVDRFGLHYFKTGKKAYDKCLEYIVNEPYPCDLWGGVQRYLDDEGGCYGYTQTAVLTVAGGLDAVKGQYPHMALLGYGEDMESAEWLCGGTLISHRYILTAAHCVSSRNTGPVKYIALGMLRRTDPADDWKKYHVKQAITHPGYRPPSKYHDIALLLTAKWVRFNHLVLPACLDIGDADDRVAFATGWGAQGYRQGLSDVLQTVVLTKYSESECKTFYRPHRLLVNGYNDTTQMCYGDKDEINDTCEGDSGGPLQVHSELSSCVHTIIGVTSHGKPCGFAGGSGMYTRVGHYVPWIESIVWP